jgi:hypothetical protein
VLYLYEAGTFVGFASPDVIVSRFPLFVEGITIFRGGGDGTACLEDAPHNKGLKNCVVKYVLVNHPAKSSCILVM